MTTHENDRDDDLLTVPDEVHIPFEALLNHLLPRAFEQLAEDGEFFPFGGALSGDEARFVTGDTGEENPDPEKVIEVVLKRLRALVAEDPGVSSVALVLDVEVEPPEGGEERIDAVAFEMEHRSGWADVTFVPYEVTEDELVDGELWSCRSDAKVFTSKG